MHQLRERLIRSSALFLIDPLWSFLCDNLQDEDLFLLNILLLYIIKTFYETDRSDFIGSNRY